MFYEMVGRISVALIAGFLLLGFVSSVLGFLLIKKHKLLLPKVLLFTVDTFYLQVKKTVNWFGIRENIVDQAGIAIRNHLNRIAFESVKAKDRIIVVPQCLRHVKCPARLDASIGVTCKECGMCMLKEVKQEAERLGYRFYIVPGGSFVERIVKAVKPGAALGVACFGELNLAMHGISKAKCAVQGVPLIKDGCIETQVDLKELINTMRLGIEKGIENIEMPCPEMGLKNAQR